MYMVYIMNGMDIQNNNVYMNTTGFYGIYLANCYNHAVGNVAMRIHKNGIYNSPYGIYLTNMSADSSDMTEIYNNIAVCRGGTTNYGIYVTTSSTYLHNTRIYHNTIIAMGATGGYGLYLTGTNTAGRSVSCYNNIFAIGGTSTYPAYFPTSPNNIGGVQAINHNVYWAPGSTNVIYRGTGYNSTNYQTATAGGDSSIRMAPSFTWHL